MQHTVTWFDRLRIERVVWTLDQRLYDLPRRTRIETRREVRQNSSPAPATSARPRRYATSAAAPNSRRSTSGRVRIGAPSLLDGSGPLLRHRSLPCPSFFADAANAFASGIIAADPTATGTYTWGGISHLQSTVTYTFSDGHGTSTGGGALSDQTL